MLLFYHRFSDSINYFAPKRWFKMAAGLNGQRHYLWWQQLKPQHVREERWREYPQYLTFDPRSAPALEQQGRAWQVCGVCTTSKWSQHREQSRRRAGTKKIGFNFDPNMVLCGDSQPLLLVTQILLEHSSSAVFFNQKMGALHAVCWLKYSFSTFQSCFPISFHHKQKYFNLLKKMILTSERCAKHPFTGRNTQLHLINVTVHLF